jgi:hypothetical protein
MFTPKKSIDAYIDNNELNSRIYEVLLYLHDCETCQKNKLMRQPLEIFNHAYAICEELQQEKHPEEKVCLPNTCAAKKIPCAGNSRRLRRKINLLRREFAMLAQEK